MSDFLKKNSWVVCILGLIATVDLTLSAYLTVKEKFKKNKAIDDLDPFKSAINSSMDRPF